MGINRKRRSRPAQLCTPCRSAGWTVSTGCTAGGLDGGGTGSWSCCTGAFGDGQQAENSYGWDQLADNANFVVAYPDGVGHTWNAHGCSAPAAQEYIDDVGYITTMVGEISAAMPIDHSRVYATGISNGGIMSYALACNGRIFAAIGGTGHRTRPLPRPAPRRR